MCEYCRDCEDVCNCKRCIEFYDAMIELEKVFMERIGE